MAEFQVQIEMCLVVSFFAILPMAIIIIAGKKWIARQEEKFTYLLCMPAWFMGVMITSALFFYVIALITSFQEELDFVLLAVPFCFIFMADMGCILALFWILAVNEEEGFIVKFHPPLSSKKISFSDITRVECLENRMQGVTPVNQWNSKCILRVYQSSEKLFEIDDKTKNFNRLWQYFMVMEAIQKQEQFESNGNVSYKFQIDWGLLKPGKVEKAEFKDDFSLKEEGGEKWRNGIITAFFGAGVIASIFNWEEWTGEDPNYVYYFLLMILFTVVFAGTFIRQLLTKITVYDHKIYVRNGIGQVKVYTIQEISGIVEKEHYIVLYSEEKKVAKVYKDYKNFASFAAWLGRELDEELEENRK